MTSLDLVGKLHRTVYIAECVEDGREDLLRLMQQRCGAIEAWDVIAESGRLVVVFQSVNSVSNALSFNGLSFVDLTKKIIVWKATDAPPAAVTQQQLAIAGGGAAASTAEDEAERQARREARQQRRAAVQEALGSDAAQFDYSNPAVREAKLRDLCFRQMNALCVLTEAAIAEKRSELAGLEGNLAVSESLLESLRKQVDAPSAASDDKKAVEAQTAGA